MLQMTDVTVLFLSKIYMHFPNIYIYMTCMSNRYFENDEKKNVWNILFGACSWYMYWWNIDDRSQSLKAFMLLKSTCVLLFFSFQNLPRLSSWPWPMEVQGWGRCWKSVDPKLSYRYIHLTHRYHTYKPLRCTMEVRNSIERHMLHILQ